MLISDVSVRRPVFAAVISLILVIIGGMSVGSMPIREFPAIERPIVSITTDYRGAASDIVERRVTQVLEDQLAGIAGITKISSVSYDERSIITLEFTRDRDIDGPRYWLTAIETPREAGSIAAVEVAVTGASILLGAITLWAGSERPMGARRERHVALDGVVDPSSIAVVDGTLAGLSDGLTRMFVLPTLDLLSAPVGEERLRRQVWQTLAGGEVKHLGGAIRGVPVAAPSRRLAFGLSRQRRRQQTQESQRTHTSHVHTSLWVTGSCGSAPDASASRPSQV